MRRATQMLLAMSAVVSATGVVRASIILAANFGGSGTVPASTVTVIDGDTLTELARIPVGVRPWGIAIHPSGTRAYVGNRNDNTISVIDLVSFTLS